MDDVALGNHTAKYNEQGLAGVFLSERKGVLRSDFYCAIALDQKRSSLSDLPLSLCLNDLRDNATPSEHPQFLGEPLAEKLSGHSSSETIRRDIRPEHRSIPLAASKIGSKMYAAFLFLDGSLEKTLQCRSLWLTMKTVDPYKDAKVMFTQATLARAFEVSSVAVGKWVRKGDLRPACRACEGPRYLYDPVDVLAYSEKRIKAGLSKPEVKKRLIEMLK